MTNDTSEKASKLALHQLATAHIAKERPLLLRMKIHQCRSHEIARGVFFGRSGQLYRTFPLNAARSKVSRCKFVSEHV